MLGSISFAFRAERQATITKSKLIKKFFQENSIQDGLGHTRELLNFEKKNVITGAN